MWPTYTTGIGTGRNRRFLKDKDGRPAVARSSSKRRKDVSRRSDNGASNSTAPCIHAMPCAEEFIENEELPALPPSRPSTASPTPSTKLEDERIDSTAALYRLAMPPITPAALQPYLEDDPPQEVEHVLHEQLTAMCTSEHHMKPPKSISQVSHPVTETGLEVTLDTPKMALLSKSTDSRLRKQPSQPGWPSGYSSSLPESAQSRPSPAPFSVMPVALPVQRHNLIHPTGEACYLPQNTRHTQAYEPQMPSHWSQGNYLTHGWQSDSLPSTIPPSSDILLHHSETQPSLMSLGPDIYSQDEVVVEGLAYQVRKAASDVEALRVQFRELLGIIDNQAWNVCELERMIDDLRRRTHMRVNNERTTMAQQIAIERTALQNKIRSLEDQIRGKEDSVLVESQDLRAQLSAAAQEVLRLKQVLAIGLRSSSNPVSRISRIGRQPQADEDMIPNIDTFENAREVDDRYNTKQEVGHAVPTRREHGHLEGVKEWGDELPQSPPESLPRRRRTQPVNQRTMHQQGESNAPNS